MSNQKPRYRVFDTATAEQLSVLVANALEHQLTLSIDFDSHRQANANYRWIVQLFDASEKDIVIGRGKTMGDAVKAAQEQWLSKWASGA